MAGIRPAEVGQFTIAELRQIAAAAQRREIRQAWLIESFARKKRLRGLEHYLKDTEAQKQPADAARDDYIDLKYELGG